jgi:hypothetical protein
MINSDKVSPHFTLGECVYLPSWKIYHVPNSKEIANIIKTCEVLEKIRTMWNKPINIHCFLRPTVVNCPGSSYNGQNYNAFVGGVSSSAHITGLGVDFDMGEDCDLTRAKLLPHLICLNIRMEDLPKANWIHIDLNSPKPNRFFKP